MCTSYNKVKLNVSDVSLPPGQMQRGGGGGGMGRGRGRRDNDLIGQTVRISQGPYKGKKAFIFLLKVHLRILWPDLVA